MNLGACLAALESESHPKRYISHPDSGASRHAAADGGRRVATQLCLSCETLPSGFVYGAIDERVPSTAQSHPTNEPTRSVHGDMSEHGGSASTARSHSTLEPTRSVHGDMSGHGGSASTALHS